MEGMQTKAVLCVCLRSSSRVHPWPKRPVCLSVCPREDYFLKFDSSRKTKKNMEKDGAEQMKSPAQKNMEPEGKKPKKKLKTREGNDFSYMSKKQRLEEDERREKLGIPNPKKQQKMRCIDLSQQRIQELEDEIADLKSPALRNQRIAKLEAENAQLKEDRDELLGQRNRFWDMIIKNYEACKCKEIETCVDRPDWTNFSAKDPNETIPMRSEDGTVREIMRADAEEYAEKKYGKKRPSSEEIVSEPPPKKIKNDLEKALATLKPSSASRSTSASSSKASSSNEVWDQGAGRSRDPVIQ